jgi:hypothetical protein
MFDYRHYPPKKSVLFFTGFQVRVGSKAFLPVKMVIDSGNNRLAVRAIFLFVHPLQMLKGSAVILVSEI